eukprot:gene25663-biopygen21011
MLFFPREVGPAGPVCPLPDASKERFSGLADAFSAPEWRDLGVVPPARCIVGYSPLVGGLCTPTPEFIVAASAQQRNRGLGWSLVFGAGTLGRRPRRRCRIRMARNTA